MNKYIKDVVEFDKRYNIESDPTYQNLFYAGLCITGEAGELVNVIKKIWRDGDSEGLRTQLAEELVDVMIYVCKLILVGKIDFDKAWKRKQKILRKKWDKKVTTQRQVKI